MGLFNRSQGTYSAPGADGATTVSAKGPDGRAKVTVTNAKGEVVIETSTDNPRRFVGHMKDDAKRTYGADLRKQ
jgi:hypothetical protein